MNPYKFPFQSHLNYLGRRGCNPNLKRTLMNPNCLFLPYIYRKIIQIKLCTHPLRVIEIRGGLFIAIFGSPLLCLRGGGEGVHRNLRSSPLPWSRCRGGLPSRSPGGYRRGSQDPWKRTHYVTMVSGFTSWFGKEGKPHYQFTPPGRFPTIPQTPHRGS